MPPRDAMDFDVVVVGAGPAGLSAAIRLKQLAAARDPVESIAINALHPHVLSATVVPVCVQVTPSAEW